MSTFFYKCIAVFLAALYSIGLPLQVRSRPLGNEVTITAHSGCMDYPDNSIEAMAAGIDVGANIVEFDLYYTADGTPVLSHNTPEEGADYVTLAEVFAFLAEQDGILANVDVKSTAHLEKVPVLAEAAGVTDRIFFTGVREEDIPVVREKCPDIPYYLNTDISKDDDFKALAEKTAALGAIGINIYWENASPRMISVFHKRDLDVSVWTVNDPDAMIEMTLMGADNITTRHPDIACDIIRRECLLTCPVTA